MPAVPFSEVSRGVNHNHALLLLAPDLVFHGTLLGACRKMSFIATATLQMALIGTVGIFRPISIGFQGEHTSNGFKFSGIGIVSLLLVS